MASRPSERMKRRAIRSLHDYRSGEAPLPRTWRPRLNGNIDCHAEIAARGADKAAADGNGLTDVARNGNANQIQAADRAIRWIVRDPTGARNVDVGPRVSRSRTDCGRRNTVGMRPVEVSGHHARSETQTASCFDQEDREIAAGAPASAERLYGSLGSLGFPALVKDLTRHAIVQVSQQRRRIGQVAPY